MFWILITIYILGFLITAIILTVNERKSHKEYYNHYKEEFIDGDSSATIFLASVFFPLYWTWIGFVYLTNKVAITICEELPKHIEELKQKKEKEKQERMTELFKQGFEQGLRGK